MNVTTLLFSLPNVTGMDFSERLSYSLRMLIVGMGVIFASLCTLWAVLALFHWVYERVTASSQEKAQNAVEPSTPAPVPVLTPQAEATSSVENDGELIAAITAAIVAERTKKGQSGAFRVVSFRRTKNHSAWNK